jgi:4-hydroxy-4-methyl-2-oxoglutarate aldolase
MTEDRSWTPIELFAEHAPPAGVLDAAADIARRERAQADRVRQGVSLRQEFRFPEYLARKVEKPDYTFREHLASDGAAVEV